MKYLVFIASLILFFSAPSYSEKKTSSSHTIYETLIGTWGHDKEICLKDPIRISFSPDRKLMYHDTKQGLMMSDASKPNERLVYRILAEYESFLRTEIIGEDRLTDGGKIVKWDLLLINQNSFCWHRSDWGKMCTEPLISCDRLP